MTSHLSHQRREQRIWGEFFRGKFTTTLAAFLLQRYSAQIAAWAAFIFLFGGPEINCQALVSTVYGTNIVFAAAVSYIFAKRTFALYNLHRTVAIGLYALWAGLIACYIIVAVRYRAVNLPVAFEGCNCAITSTGKISFLGFVASLVFDLVILVLTLGRLYYLRFKSKIGDTIRSSSITYFVAVSAVNLALVLIIAISDDPTISATPLGPAFAVTYLLINRMVFGMRERSRTANNGSVGRTTDQSKHKHRNSSRVGGLLGILGGGGIGSGNNKLGSNSGSQPSNNFVGAERQGTQPVPMDRGIPMTVTVAQNCEGFQADRDLKENVFAHLGSHPYSASEDHGSPHLLRRSHPPVRKESSGKNTSETHSQKDYESAAARESDLEAGDRGELRPYGPFYNN